MKRIIGNLLLFLLSTAFFCCIYVGVFKMSAETLGILFVIFTFYAFCMGLGWKSTEEIKKFERKAIHFGLTDKDDFKILFFSLATLSPTYFCVIIVSLVPLYTYEIWFITVFPCILLNCLPANSVLEEYRCLTHRTIPFVALFALLTVIFCGLGAMISGLFFT
jgi:hypothetical protein